MARLRLTTAEHHEALSYKGCANPGSGGTMKVVVYSSNNEADIISKLDGGK